jgi:hypothetical protein
VELDDVTSYNIFDNKINIQDVIIKLTYSHSPLIDVERYKSLIEQIGECIIRYFGRPCDEFAERVWSIKISDGARRLYDDFSRDKNAF